VKHRSTIRTGIETGLAPNALFFIGDDRVCFRESLSSARWAGCHAGRLLTVLTDDWHKDRDLFPLLHVYSRKGRAAGTLMGEATNHLTGLASGAAFRDN
jgi:hypothetical protein